MMLILKKMTLLLNLHHESKLALLVKNQQLHQLHIDW